MRDILVLSKADALTGAETIYSWTYTSSFGRSDSPHQIGSAAISRATFELQMDSAGPGLYSVRLYSARLGYIVSRSEWYDDSRALLFQADSGVFPPNAFPDVVDGLDFVEYAVRTSEDGTACQGVCTCHRPVDCSTIACSCDRTCPPLQLPASMVLSFVRQVAMISCSEGFFRSDGRGGTNPITSIFPTCDNNGNATESSYLWLFTPDHLDDFLCLRIPFANETTTMPATAAPPFEETFAQNVTQTTRLEIETSATSKMMTSTSTVLQETSPTPQGWDGVCDWTITSLRWGLMHPNGDVWMHGAKPKSEVCPSFDAFVCSSGQSTFLSLAVSTARRLGALDVCGSQELKLRLEDSAEIFRLVSIGDAPDSELQRLEGSWSGRCKSACVTSLSQSF